MNLTDNAFARIYEFMYSTYRLIGTRYRQVVTKDTLLDMVDEGIVYSYCNSGTLGNGASALFLGKVNGTNVHFYDLDVMVSTGTFTIELYEAPTVSANGTIQTAINLNRNSTNTSHLDIYATPTVSANGTLLRATKIFESGTAGKNSGSALVKDKWLLKTNTDYLVKITNDSGGSANFVGCFSFFERNIY